MRRRRPVVALQAPSRRVAVLPLAEKAAIVTAEAQLQVSMEEFRCLDVAVETDFLALLGDELPAPDRGVTALPLTEPRCP